ncbi:lamin tail domain-containing protein [Winogradskyella jejuensis]|uniref:Por secretion system C-terminal sorting domain-containing protein n=1 Tax=Winogradskyella jejuensis TaxID=1089305 RepID=A0A1M5M6Q5_9FLAO|nr:lamin tail domain-containing protein [Winogradskyella jejuensis]SHG72974.1 Por secretion system C-terminal sorting domain-containing protein [Winogradskyella jejuensis]
MLRKLPLILLLLVSFINLSYSQTTIYSEDFTGQDGKGAIGPGPITDVSGVSWTVDISNASLTATNDYFQVRNEMFEARDLDTDATWLSPVIDITNFTNVQFSLEASENDTTDTLEDADTFVTEYRIDGGAWTLAANNGTIINDFPLTVVSDTGLSGSTIELRVTITVNGNDERPLLDNILVEGTAPVIPTVNVSPSSITGLGYVEGDASLTEQSFGVVGSTLTTDIVITAPTNFEISLTSGTGFGGSVNLTPASGDVALTNIYVRLISGLTVNTYSGNITLASTGITTINVPVDGEVTATIPNCSELIISEYHEPQGAGTGNNKYIELYNPTNSTIDLTAYRIARYSNGGTLPNIANLSGTVGPYSTFLLSRNGAAITGDLVITGNALNFSGNDVMALQTINGENIDVIGFIGDGSNFAQNTVLRRNQDVTIPTVAYDVSQWTTAPVNDTSDLGLHVNDCACLTSTTWDGTSWSAGTPDAFTAAILDGDYTVDATNPSFTACSLVINSGGSLTISNGYHIEIMNDITVVDDGSASNEITVETRGSLVQRGDGALAGSFTLGTDATSVVNKTTSPLTNWYDVTYWSSPVVDESTDGALFNSSRVFWFDANNYIDADGDNLDDDANAWIREQGDFPMTPGQGFAGSHNQIGFLGPGFSYSYVFEGAYNTGDITYPVVNDPTNGLHWNLIGNPYPSAIDIDAFFNQNGTVAPGNNTVYEVVYMWSQVNPVDGANPGNEVLNYNQNDYITVNALGEAGNGTTAAPSRQIPSGQAFFVPSASSGNVVFTNSMRVSGDNSNDEFFRSSSAQTSSSVEKLNINLSSDIGIYSQICVAYADIATDEDDGNTIDTSRNYAGNAGVLYSLDNNGDGFYVIQGKAKSSLNEDETVKLGFGAYITTTETYKLELVKREGEYLTSNPIYLKDNMLNIVHDLTSEAYIFTSEGGTFDERFEIVFKNQALSVEEIDFNENSLIITEVEKDKIMFELKSSSLTIDTIAIYDLQGRLVYDLEGDSNSETYNLSNLNSQVYIAKVKLSNGLVISKKSIKK